MYCSHVQLFLRMLSRDTQRDAAPRIIADEQSRTLVPSDSFRYESHPGTAQQWRHSSHSAMPRDSFSSSSQSSNSSGTRSVTSITELAHTHSWYEQSIREIHRVAYNMYTCIVIRLTFLCVYICYRSSVQHTVVVADDLQHESRHREGAAGHSVTLAHLAHSLHHGR